MSDKSEWKKLRKNLQRQGCDVVQAKSGHWKVHKGHRLVTTMSFSPSDPRTYRNVVAHLRREGFEV